MVAFQWHISAIYFSGLLRPCEASHVLLLLPSFAARHHPALWDVVVSLSSICPPAVQSKPAQPTLMATTGSPLRHNIKNS